MDDDIYTIGATPDQVMAELWSLRKPIEDDGMRGPFPEAPEDLPVFQMDVTFPVWQGSYFPVIVKQEAIVMIHPMVRNYYHIRQIEERTGRVAIAKLGYIELVNP